MYTVNHITVKGIEGSSWQRKTPDAVDCKWKKWLGSPLYYNI